MEGVTAADMFRPPIQRNISVLDRSRFTKTLSLNAARIFNNKDISRIRSQLVRSKDILDENRIDNIHSDPDEQLAKRGGKCILLRPSSLHHVNGEDASKASSRDSAKDCPTPYSPVITELVNQRLVSIIPFNLTLDYRFWTYQDVITAILPEEAQDEVPSGFSQVGHVAHLNLRDAYLPYKNLIAEIILDKNPAVRTVINKIDDVGQENEFRTFKYEVLAGPDDMNVIVSEANCTFAFDYSRVYWNSRLQTEHTRLVSLFQPGEAVCDVMAGIGPFAVPAGKKEVFVWANDLNPDSYHSLVDTIKRNKVEKFVQPFNLDGKKFIRGAAQQLLHTDYTVELRKKQSRRDAKNLQEIPRFIEQPKVFSHFVMNLPASALSFLSSFVGLYPAELQKMLPQALQMPLIHVYCFSTKDEQTQRMPSCENQEDTSHVEEDTGAIRKICAEISKQLQFEMHPGSMNEIGGVEIHDVRDVAPKKRMFCATFRLPEEVAFKIG